MTTVEQLSTQLADLKTATEQLSQMLASKATTSGDFIAQLKSIQTTTNAMVAIGPVEKAAKIPGMYTTWSELVLALVAAQEQQLNELSQQTLEQTIATVRTLRRTFNLAPGGA